MALTSAAALSFAGCAAVAFSPAIVLFVMVVGRQPDLVIVLVGSAFVWLLSISLVAFVWVVLAPLKSQLWLVVLYGAVVQEAARWLTYQMHARLIRGLKAAGLQAIPASRLAGPLGLTPAAVANGLGIGVVQTLVLHGDVLGRALLPGSLYTVSCTHLSVFSVSALCSLGMLITNVLLSIVGWTVAYPLRSRRFIGAMVLLHALASGATLLNSPALIATDGCTVALPVQLGAVLLTAGFTARLALVGGVKTESKS